MNRKYNLIYQVGGKSDDLRVFGVYIVGSLKVSQIEGEIGHTNMSYFMDSKDNKERVILVNHFTETTLPVNYETRHNTTGFKKI